MHYVYVIKSLKNGELYKGQTEDLSRRVEAHNSGLSPYTKGKVPWKLVYYENFLTRGEAMKREKILKSGKGREWLKEKLINLDSK